MSELPREHKRGRGRPRAASSLPAGESGRRSESSGRAPSSGQRPPGGLQQQQQRPRTAPSKGGGGAAGLDAHALSQRLAGLSLSAPAPEGAVGRGQARTRGAAQDACVFTRPQHISSKRGVSGAKSLMQANYFRLETHTDWKLYQYRVDFDPEIDQTFVKKALLRVHRETLGGYIFDGSIMFTSHLLSQDRSNVILFSERKDDMNVTITIRLVDDLAMDLHYIHFFNILMKKCLNNLKLQLVGRNYFDPIAKVVVRDFKLELWPGYITSIRQHESSILMCAEITHKVMRQDTVLNILTDIIRGGERDYRRKFQQSIIGAIVLTDYNNRTYRVDDVDFNETPNSKFKLKSGTEITYKDYYQQKYQITIIQNDQPMLVSRTKARDQRSGESSLVYLIPELSRMTGLTDQMKNNFQLMAALAEHTRMGPRNRVEKLLKFGQRLIQEQVVVNDFTEWNMKLADKLVEFEARALQNEAIVQAASDKYYPSALVDWTRDLRSRQLLVSPELKVWAAICPGRIRSSVVSFISTLQEVAGGMRFRMPAPQLLDIMDDRAGTYLDAIEKVINRSNPELIMIIVPNNRADRYSSIKKKCCVDRAVSSQVILAKNLTAKGVMSIATKVAVQIACKIGGAPWTVDIPLSGLMVAGYDVYHDPSSRSRSYGALVASLEKSMARYFSAVTAHSSGEELSNDLASNLRKAVKRYKLYNNGALPTRIMFYRDGVGDGQIPYVFEHEVNNIRAALEKVYAEAGTTLKMAFVIVNKRINTRIFVNSDNPPPGTLVDDCITLPERYDFFLVSQTVRQGTVTPTYYNVISDNVGLEPDKIQRLTYKLTHMYFNWSGTVRVPAPCQYAHKLAYFVGQALHRNPSDSLNDFLYYL